MPGPNEPNNYTGKRKPLLTRLTGPRSNNKPLEGQHLVVKAGEACDRCGADLACHAVKRGAQLVCLACDKPPPTGAAGRLSDLPFSPAFAAGMRETPVFRAPRTSALRRAAWQNVRGGPP